MLNANVIGNLGSDPDVRYSASGSPMLRVNVAANFRTRTPEGEYQDRTEWVRVTVLGKRAETLGQHLKKGTKVYASGRLEARPWTDNNGQIRAGLELLADTVEFMSARESGDDQMRPPATVNRQPVAAGTRQQSQGQDDADLESLPF
jgi:single-strand DNA-binding protein